MIPEFALIGHPNEGKSSILSTLTEDDSVVVSSTPGETSHCRSFPLLVDGIEILRFTDTPGFQNPGQLLDALEQGHGSTEANLVALSQMAMTDRNLAHDFELLQPLLRGAGVLYIVDGSRPVRQVDRIEMEFLRLSGRPRIAIINCKAEKRYLKEWKSEFRKSFNSYRVFNAHRASYRERISLLQALCYIDQDWQEAVKHAIAALEQDWAGRTEASSQIIANMLEQVFAYKLVKPLSKKSKHAQEELLSRYTVGIGEIERRAHGKIRALFKHNLFNYQLPKHSLLHDDIFTETNWKVLGMNKKQLLLAGGVGGATLGAGVDLAAAGLSFGIFTAVGSLGGALSALWGGGRAVKKGSSLIGIKLAGEEIQVGPCQNINLLFVLLNRALLFYRHSSNWAHGRRDYTESSDELMAINQNFTHSLSTVETKLCQNYLRALTGKKEKKREQSADFLALLKKLIYDLGK